MEFSNSRSLNWPLVRPMVGTPSIDAPPTLPPPAHLNAVRHLFALLWAVVMLVVTGSVTLSAQSTTFESFNLGTVHYQGTGTTVNTGPPGNYTVPNPYGSLWTLSDEWGFQKTGSPFDQEVKDDGSGNKVWRMSNAVTSGSFSFQPYSQSTALVAGESTAALYNDRGNNHTTPLNPPNPRAYSGSSYFHGGFKFKSATGTAQPGLFLSINAAPRQSSVRMTYIGLSDNGSTGIDLTFIDVTAGGASFPTTTIASNLSYSDWHRVDFYVQFVDGLNGDGSGNDIVTVMLDGNIIHTGTTWETFYSSPSWTSTPAPIAVDALMFRAGGTAVPATAGNGYYFDNVAYDNESLPVKVRVYSDLAETDYVNGYSTIQAAINNATTLPGYVVRVSAGTYPENITVNKALIFRGPNFGNSAQGSTNRAGRVAEAVLQNFILNTAATIDGFSFEGANTYNGELAQLQIFAPNCTIKNTIFNGKLNSPFQVGGINALGILLGYNTNTGGLLVDGCYFVRLRTGVFANPCDPSSTLTFQNNEFSSRTGINFDLSWTKILANIHDNLFQLSTADGNPYGPVTALNLGEVPANSVVSILRNTWETNFVGIDFKAIRTGASSVIVSNNTFKDIPTTNSTGIFIFSEPSTGASISNNFFTSSKGIQNKVSSASEGNSITNNSFTVSGTLAIENLGTGALPATCNWYGTTNAATIATLISGNVTYSPFLVNGTDNAPGTTGFQPVPNACSGCSNQPRLQTSINGIVVTSNNDGTTDAGTFTVCNGTPNNVVLGNFTELNGVTPATNLRVYQTVALTNATFGYCNNCQALLSAFTPGSPATLALVNPTIPGSAVVTFRLWNDDSPANNVLDNGECASDVIQYTITVNPLPQLQTTINTVQVTNNSNGTDDSGTFTVCNANTNNLFFTQFADLTGATPAANVKVIQQFTRTNVTFTPADGVAPLSAYTPAFDRNVALVNTAMSGTLVMRFRVFYDADNSNTLDAGECANDWIQYTVTVNQGSGFAACPANPIVVSNDPGNCSAAVPYTVTASGSPAPTMTYAFSGATTGSGSGTGSGSVFNKGTTTVLVTATNACGASFCSFSITVNDNERPTLSNCPANKTLKTSDDGGSDCAVTLFYVAPTFSDNCDGTGTATYLSGPASGTSLTVGGPYTITYTKSDLSGNAVLANCVFNVTVQDDTKPVISCPANIIRSSDPGQCSAVVTYTTPTATDNCGSANVTLQSAANTASGSTFPTGTTTVEWKATDVATPTANTATCSFTITIQETQAPTLTCPPNQVRTTATGTCAASATYTATASDNCTASPILSYSFSGATTVAPWAAGTGSGSNFNKGITTVALRAVDEAGLTRTCTFRIIVNDGEAPTLLNCNSPAPVNAAANACSAVVTYATPTFTDNCAPTSGTAVRISGPVSGSSISVGSNNVIFQATDASGKTSRCTITLTVADNQAPVVVCPPSSTVSGDGIPCTKQVFYTTPTASDNCDGTLTAFLFSGWSSGSIFPAGVTTNTWRAVASNGQTGECTFMVTVNCAANKPLSSPNMARPAHITAPLEDLPVLTLAPNPSRDYVVFALTGMDTNGDLLAFDALGRLMVQQAVAVGQEQGRLDVSNWPQGTYRICVKTDRALVTKTLVVQQD